MSVSPQALRPRTWHELARRARRFSVADLPLLMPYIYVVVMVVRCPDPRARADRRPGRDRRANFSLVVPLALVAFGQTLAMLTRGIDLSVGGVISVSSALLATHLNATGWLILPEVLAIVALGVLIGCLNGLMIAFTPIQPFIVTLATWSIWDGVAFGILPIEGGTVSPTLINAGLGRHSRRAQVGLDRRRCSSSLWRWLRATRFIDDLVAIGSDESRARLLGVRIGKRKIQCYAASGLLAALAAIWVTGQTQAGSPDGGDQFILSSVAAVVIGGTSIFGGKGSAASSIMGAITFLLIPILVFALNLTSFWSIFLQGLDPDRRRHLQLDHPDAGAPVSGFIVDALRRNSADRAGVRASPACFRRSGRSRRPGSRATTTREPCLITASFIGLVGFGQTLCMLTGGIDLSIPVEPRRRRRADRVPRQRTARRR